MTRAATCRRRRSTSATSGEPGRCTNNAGDPRVNYDSLADRWVLAQFQFPAWLCFAVSETPDPLGAYHLYEFVVPEFPDYFKVGVWRNGYYVSANESSYTAYAFDRAKMLAGNPNASFVRFAGETNFLMPADVDGKNVGPAGGGLFYTFKDSDFHGGGRDRIELFQLDPDFAVPANSTFALIRTFNVAPFTFTVCGFFNFNCIPQKDTAQKVDAVSEWPMQRFAYRKIGSRQELVGNFTVGGGSADPGAAIRWFELRRGDGSWRLLQEGTLDPGDSLNRFMGSISIDQDGNIALGYSVSSSSTYPSIRYATRTPSDPPGTMGPSRPCTPEAARRPAPIVGATTARCRPIPLSGAGSGTRTSTTTRAPRRAGRPGSGLSRCQAARPKRATAAGRWPEHVVFVGRW